MDYAAHFDKTGESLREIKVHLDFNEAQRVTVAYLECVLTALTDFEWDGDEREYRDKQIKEYRAVIKSLKMKKQ
jgi:hypothetical protein